MNTQTLNIEGMTCNACASRVTKALMEVPGVADAKVSLAGGTAEVTAHGLVDPSLLTGALEKKGYRASIVP